jgi:DNA-binding PadR family transcriptional regulator
MSINSFPTNNLLGLAVLSLLLEKPMHPYEMRATVQERGLDNVIPLKGASIYDTVERLLKSGLVEATETSREGKRPERTVYAITDTGRDAFKAWMQELLGRPVHEYPRFATALAFVYGLQKEEAVDLLQHRLIELGSEIGRLEGAIRTTIEELQLPRIFMVETRYALALLVAERDFVKGMLRELTEGDLWPDLETVIAFVKSRGQGGEHLARRE